MSAKALEDLLKRVNRTPTCWLWTGAIDHGGYGAVRSDGKTVKVHRLMYTLIVGSIPEGLGIDHLCRTRGCCNPDHLQPVTTRENTRRGNANKQQKAKTHCSKGHAFTPENTYFWRGSRTCRTCNLHYTHLRRRKASQCQESQEDR